MTKARIAFIQLVFFLQVFMLAKVDICIANTSLIPASKLVFSKLDFSPEIIEKADIINNIFKLGKIEIFDLEQILSSFSIPALFGIMKSNWHVQMDTDNAFKDQERMLLQSNFKRLGMHEAINQKNRFISYPAQNSLLVFLGAHPRVLCTILDDLKDISRYVDTVLVSASNDIYKRSEYSCDSLTNYSQIAIMRSLGESASLRDVIKAYLQCFGINDEKMIFIDDTTDEINNSVRLRQYLLQNIHLFDFSSFNKLLLMAPQPFALEAYRVLEFYLGDKIKTTYKLYYLSSLQPNLMESLIALIDYLETDYELQYLKNQ